MSINVNPYLQFPGTAREAMTFYASVLGGELGLSTLGDFGMGEGEAAGRVMHSQLVIDDRAFLMGADQMEGLPVNAGPIGTVALFGGVEDAAEMEKRWEALADGATIVEPMAQAPWGGPLRHAHGPLRSAVDGEHRRRAAGVTQQPGRSHPGGELRS